VILHFLFQHHTVFLDVRFVALSYHSAPEACRSADTNPQIPDIPPQVPVARREYRNAIAPTRQGDGGGGSQRGGECRVGVSMECMSWPLSATVCLSTLLVVDTPQVSTREAEARPLEQTTEQTWLN
jgi:hypothetical protein